MDIEQKAETSVGQNRCSDRKEPENMNSVSRVKKLVSRRLLVGIKDGRFFLGTFYCMDKQGNIILQDAVEYRSTRHTSPSPMEQRGLGLILIPFSCRTSCHVDCSIEEQMSLLYLQKEKIGVEVPFALSISSCGIFFFDFGAQLLTVLVLN